ncbi:MAG: hypothetical protein JW717_12025 [Marinilabiliaceae bacterium]|nr:hypothetical protein [Marinilabiliaceae bacterium]
MLYKFRIKRQLLHNKYYIQQLHYLLKKTSLLFAGLVLCMSSTYSQNYNIRFNHITSDNGLSQNTIDDIHKDSRGFVWFATRNGLNRYDGYSIKIYKAENSELGLSNNFVHCICEDLEGNLWIGTENGLNIFDTKKNTFTVLFNNPEKSDSISNNIVTDIVCDKNWVVWAGTHSQGLIRIQKSSNEEYITEQYQHNPNVSGGLSSNTIHTLFLDKENKLWIGTENGINKLSISTNTYEVYRFNSGETPPLCHNSVSSIFEDSYGYIWIGTWNGLNRLNKATGEIKYFLFDTGNQSDISNSAINTINEDIEGNLLIGSINGLYKFVRKENRFYQFSVSSNNDYALSNELISCIETDSLGNVWIGTHMGGVNHYNVHQKKFKHIVIEPLPKETNNNNVINSIYTDQKTLWIGTAGSGLYCLDKLTRKYNHFKNIPGDLQSINGDYVSAIKKEEITVQRDELIDLNKKVQHVNQLKLRFFTNISHEFRTPLTLIAGPVKKLLTSNPEPDETKKSLLIIDRNVQRLIYLINQLLDFRKVETDKLNLTVTKGNLISFINTIYTSFEQLVQEKQISFTFTHEDAINEHWFDHEKLENILFNLLSNAFKHTSENGKISISLTFNSNPKLTDSPVQAPTALIQVTDTGIGISPEHIDHIFKRFYQIDTPENIKNRGSGIGLSLTKDLVIAHHGTIHVKSEVGKVKS